MKRAREEQASLPHAKRPSESSEQPRLTTDDALKYLQSVKQIFKDDCETYGEFLEVMKEFKAQRLDTNGVVARVKELFKGHDKLLLGFNDFLPKGYEITLPGKQPVEFDQAINFVNKIKTRFQDNEQVYKAFLEILNNYRKGYKSIGEVYEEVASLFRDHPDLLDEFTRFLPDNSSTVRPIKDEKAPPGPSARSAHDKSVKKEKASDREALKSEKDQRRREKREDRDRREESERDADLDGAQRLPHKRKSARRADELIRKQSQNGEGGFVFFERAKARLRNNRESYKELIKVVNLYNEQIIERSDLQSLASGLLEKYPDLVEAFNELLQSENAEGYLGAVSKKLEPDTKRDRERDQEKDKDGDIKDHKASLLPLKDKNLNKPISELDLSNCEKCTPSYRLLPKHYPRLISSHRNELASSVLNDSWVSVTSGSEDYSFKHMRRNQYEESLFRCEDDRFELDMLLESTIITAKHVAELIEKLKESNHIRLEDYLSAINLRCIERIYGDHGLDIIDLMRKFPSNVLPVLHTRLMQKQEEWSRCRTDMNKVWAEVYAKNYHKSLDHRSFYFKQQDKKSLSSKGLVAEIKEIHDKKKKEEEFILSTVTGNRRPSIPDMKFSYPDASIHEDLFQIMKYSADEVCNSMEQSDKIMRVWTLFLECVFGIPSRLRGTEDTEEAAKSKVPDTKIHSSSTESAASGAGKTVQDECATASSLPQSAKAREKTDDMEIDVPEEHRKASAEKDVTVSKATRESRRRSSVEPKDSVAHFQKSHCSSPVKAEREEGELSPSRVLDEKQNAEPGEQSMKNSGKQTARQEDDDEVGPEAVHEAGVDEDAEESAQSEDSEHASDAAEEVSGSDIGSPEDREEEEGGEEKPESDCEGMADAEDAEGEDRSWMFCRPLAPQARHLDPKGSTRSNTVFYGNDMFYILFRLYQTFYERIRSAKVNAAAAEQKRKTGKDTSPNYYQKFVRVLYNLLDGSADNAKFEDECRAIIGTQSYVLFTLDKLIFKIVKQLQTISGDETASKLVALHTYEKSRGPAGSSDLIYHANSCVILHDENIYRFEHRPVSSDFIVQLMDGAAEKIEVPPNAMEFSFSNYLSAFLGVSDSRTSQNIFLRRNKSPVDLEAAMRDVQVVNGLEYKISCKTSKVSYVLDTEDLFHRRKQKRDRKKVCECSICLAPLDKASSTDVCTVCLHFCLKEGVNPPKLKSPRRRAFREWIDSRLRDL